MLPLKVKAEKLIITPLFSPQAVLFLLLLTFIVAAIFPGTAFAHRMLVEKEAEGLFLVRFDDGTVAKNASVTLYDRNDQVISEGQTNREGYYKTDQKEKVYRVVADDGMGHRASWARGEKSAWDEVPRWMKGLLGISLLLFIAAVAKYRSAG